MVSSPEHPSRQPERVLTLPNVITFIRLALVPIAYALLVSRTHNLAAFITFGIAASTDWVDGQVARRTGTVTQLGKELDPLVDRFLLAAGVVGLCVIGRLPLWLTAVLVARDVLMLSGSTRLKLAGLDPMPVMYIGKVTTAMLMVGFAGAILDWPQVPGLGVVDAGWLPGFSFEPTFLWVWFIYVGTVLSIVSASMYLRRGAEIYRARPRT